VDFRTAVVVRLERGWFAHPTGPRDSRQPASAAHRAAVATVAASTRSARCHHDRLNIFGYDETHMGIRNNAAVAAHLNAVLETP